MVIMGVCLILGKDDTQLRMAFHADGPLANVVQDV